MTSVAHTLVAGAIATKTENPLVGMLLAVCLHYILDSIPHWDFGTNWRKRPKWITGVVAIIDTTVGMSLSFILFSPHVASQTTLLFILIASILPDIAEAPWYIWYAKATKPHEPASQQFWEQVWYRVYSLQNTFHAKTSLPLGIMTQVVAVGCFLYLLLV